MKYLRFASSYRKRQIQELEGTFSDCKETRLSGTDEFSADEVVGLLDSLCSTIKADVYRSIQTLSNSNGILLKQLFAQAEDSGNTFNIDTSILEDEFLLSSMKKLEAEAESQAIKSVTSMEASSSSSSSMLAAKLPNLQEQAKAEELMKSNAALKKHEMELENEVVAGSLFLSKYCNRKEEQLAKLRKELKAKEAEHKRELDQISQKIMDEVASAKASSDSAASNQEVMKLGAQIKELKLSLGEVEVPLTCREILNIARAHV